MKLTLSILALPIATAFAQAPKAVMPEKHLAVFENYCFDCHDAETEKGNVNLEALSFDISKDIETAERWGHVLNAINAGEMPPAKKEQISAAEKTAFLKDLSEQMVVARKVLSDSGGVVTLRRLNRREYANTIEALLGVHPNVTNLPDDQATAGFDTQGASLFFSSDQLENYLATARATLELALTPKKPATSKIVRVEPEREFRERFAAAARQMRDNRDRALAFFAQDEKPASEFGFLDAYQAKNRKVPEWLPLMDSYAARPETATGATLITTIKQGGIAKVKLPSLGVKEGGKYTIRVRAAAYPDAEERFHYLEFAAVENRNSRRLGWRKVTGTLENPQTIEFTVDHPPGEKLQYVIHQRSHQDRGDKNLATRDMRANGVGSPPGLWVDWAELEGPHPDPSIAQRPENVLFPRPEKMKPGRYSKEVLHSFAKRAFRGAEPDPEFMKQLYARFEANRTKGLSPTQALLDPLSIILSSPSFLYMVESTGNENSLRLTDTELAVRLSYFLWSSPPDEELMRIAKAGGLSGDGELKRQTSRLLADPRADRFVRSFTYQWLEIHRLDMFQFKALLYPTFDNAARESAREEIFETVHLMLDEKLPLKTLLESDFIVINDLLAGYYGIPGVEGPEFRKVSLPAGSKRGGLIGTAAVLAMGSDGLRTSPVERGVWILRHLLNDPPPPAPPNVPMISRLDDKPLSSRQRTIIHQEEPQCAQCHQKIDPLGFALENFAADGLWRDKELVYGQRIQKGKPTEFAIDPSGKLMSGESFAGYTELRDLVATKGDSFARGYAEALISYGLGRPFGFIDHDLADQLLEKASASDYEMSQFIHALVQSDPFQTK